MIKDNHKILIDCMLFWMDWLSLFLMHLPEWLKLSGILQTIMLEFFHLNSI